MAFQRDHFETNALLDTDAFQVMTVESSMVGNRHNFKPFLHATFTSVLLILSSFGIVCHLRYGEDTAQIILDNLPPSIFVLVLNIILFLSVLCTYPLQLFPVIEIVEFLCFRNSTRGNNAGQSSVTNEQQSLTESQSSVKEGLSDKDNSCTIEKSTENESVNYDTFPKETDSPDRISLDFLTVDPDPEKDFNKNQERMLRIIHNTKIKAPAWKRNILRISVVFVQCGIAILARNSYAYVVALNGAIGGSFLAYVLPGAIHFGLRKYVRIKWHVLAIDVVVVALGIMGSVCSLIDTIQVFIG